MLFVLIFIVFMYHFTCISFAIRPSGRKSAIKLIDYLFVAAGETTRKNAPLLFYANLMTSILQLMTTK